MRRGPSWETGVAFFVLVYLSAMDPHWIEVFAEETKKPYFRQLAEFVREERQTKTVYPPAGDVFNAFATPLDKVKVLILGQDPYHGSGQAHGLSFSVPQGPRIPPSLSNIFKELVEDVGCPKPKHGNLSAWAEQGVLLLNATLTVRAHEAGSHQGKGWETFTDTVIKILNDRPPMTFVLWGRYARDKKALIGPQHKVIESAHPSPMSATSGFFGSRPFSKVNQALTEQGHTPIDWSLT